MQFLCECVLQQRDFDGQGAILADDMGLGKTLQSVATIYTLLTQGFVAGQPVCKKAIVVCPVSLVANWGKEFEKWLGPGALNVKALAEANKDVILAGIRDYCNDARGVQVLVISYDAFRRHAAAIYRRDTDLLVCDEAHRLKNSETGIYKQLNKLQCRRRILLSGTPMQNALTEFYAMVNFTNPDVLGDQNKFSRVYQTPILVGREPFATDAERRKGDDCATRLSNIVNQFIVRRTNTLLSAHLPPKVMHIVCCDLTPLQKTLYAHFRTQMALANSELKAALAAADADAAKDGADNANYDDDDDDEGGGKKRGGNSGVQVLPLIGLLKTLCNHPKLVYDVRKTSSLPGMGPALDALFPRDFEQTAAHPRFSGKMDALDRLLCAVKAMSDDKFVLISNYTQTLDLFEALCNFRGWKFLRVDGSTTIKKRQERVDELSRAGNNYFCFLLSSKAGGCGLNLVGANRLVLFDPDWNPAVDKQAAARVWRDGQKKRCFVYRFLAAGSIEEKVYQRQLSKEGLADVMGGNNTEAQVSREDLKDLFTLVESSRSTTHDTLACRCCDTFDADCAAAKSAAAAAAAAAAAGDGAAASSGSGRVTLRWGQRGKPAEDDLANWSHHPTVLTTPDPMLRFTHTSNFANIPVKSAGNLKCLAASAGAPAASAGPVRSSMRVAVAASAAPRLGMFGTGSAAFAGGSSKAKKNYSDDIDDDDDSNDDVIAVETPAAKSATDATEKTADDAAAAERPLPDAAVVAAASAASASSDSSSGSGSGSGSRTGTPGSGVRPFTALRASPAAKPAAATALAVWEPVRFVFSCEVSGKEIVSPVEEINKRATAIVERPRAVKKERGAAAAAAAAAAKAGADADAAAAADAEAGDGDDDADGDPLQLQGEGELMVEMFSLVGGSSSNSNSNSAGAAAGMTDGYDAAAADGGAGDNDAAGEDGGDGKKKARKSRRKKAEEEAPVVALPPPKIAGPKSKLPAFLAQIAADKRKADADAEAEAAAAAAGVDDDNTDADTDGEAKVDGDADAAKADKDKGDSSSSSDSESDDDGDDAAEDADAEADAKADAKTESKSKSKSSSVKSSAKSSSKSSMSKSSDRNSSAAAVAAGASSTARAAAGGQVTKRARLSGASDAAASASALALSSGSNSDDDAEV